MTQKIFNREDAARQCQQWKAEGLVVGYTSGAFDILHAGHVSYLNEAKTKCDRLIVGLNTDESVRQLKGEKRPICKEEDRALVLSSLSSVDALFLFSDKNNNENIAKVKPDVYIKAGDYTEDQLTSAPIVKKHGGRVEIIPFREGLSTSGVINTISERYSSEENSTYIKGPLPEMRPAAFLDRDGTINKHVQYLHEPEKFELLPGALEGLKAFQDAGFRIVIVTNQAGIGLGYFTKEDLYRVNKEMLRLVSAQGIKVDKIYFSPYSKADDSICRKPNTGMIDRAVEELNLDLSASFVIGDQTSDVQLAKNAGCRAILVETGQAGADGLYEVTADFTAQDLKQAALIAKNEIGDYTPKVPSLERKPSLSADMDLEPLGEFAGKIGHDFNNILGTVKGCVDLINSRVKKLNLEENPFERQLKILDSAVDRGVIFTTRLRSFVRAESIPLSDTNLEDCVSSVLETLKSSGQLSTEVIVNVTKNPPVQIAEFMVVQMILGICVNSIEAMRKLKDQVLIIHIDEVDHSGRRFARLSVVDHGSGLSEKACKNLFQPFFTTKSKALGKGFGLGLSNAKALMEKHGGLINVFSEKEIGTAVHLYFPLQLKAS